MKEAIGLFLLLSATICGITFMFGFDLSLKEKIQMIIGSEVFIAMLICGTYLLIP